MSGRWVDLREAAELLDASTEAVRKRAARGSLRSERHNGRVRVWVDDGRTEGGREAQVDRASLLEAKDETIQVLTDQLREEREARKRADTLLAQLMQRIPELEAPSKPTEYLDDEQDLRDEAGMGGRTDEQRQRWHAYSQGAPRASESVAEVADRGHAPEEQEGPAQRPWWRRVFGG